MPIEVTDGGSKLGAPPGTGQSCRSEWGTLGAANCRIGQRCPTRTRCTRAGLHDSASHSLVHSRPPQSVNFIGPGQRQPPGVIHGAINQVRVRSTNAIDWLESDPLQPLKIPESRLLFIYFADIRRGAAGRTDCCLRMAAFSFFAFA
jgi:hypothetical protein